MDAFWQSHLVNQMSERASGQDGPPGGGAAGSDSADVRHLEARVERLALACEALWNLLQQKVGVTEEELRAHMADLDLADGTADGRVRRPPNVCPKCQRPNSRRHQYCLYCCELLETSPFE